MRARVAGAASLAALALFSFASIVAPAVSAQEIPGVWQVGWDSAHMTSSSLAGRVARGGSAFHVTATIQISAPPNLPDRCAFKKSFTLTQDTSPALSDEGYFSGVNPAFTCNGTYTASLNGSAPLTPDSDTFDTPLPFLHPSWGVAAPTVKAGGDGTSLDVSWAPPAGNPPDLVGYHVVRTFTPAGGGKAVVKEADVETASYTEHVGASYGSYSYTVAARYWGVGGPKSAEVSSAASQPVLATVAAPSPAAGVPVKPSPNPAAGVPPIPNLPRTEIPNISVPGLPGTTEVPDPQRVDTPEPGGPDAVKPKSPLSATAMVDHPTGGGLNGRTIAVVAASVLVLGLIAAQLAFLSRRAAALELLTEDEAQS